MSLDLKEFSAFFSAVHDGARAFPWQLRLVDCLMTDGQWPQQVAAPTGAGKTAVIDAHVFAVAAMANGSGAVVPRRLAMVVPRRVLVDSQYDHASRLARMLGPDLSGQPEVVLRVAHALRTLRWEQAPAPDQVSESPLVVARLRGGLPAPRSWRDDPVACAVLSCTPDMWGSRLLLHAYGSSFKAWPREAGLIGIDSVVVVDEAHLCRQLVTSARSVAVLQGAAEQVLAVPPLQVVEATATPAGIKQSVCDIEGDDLAEPVLAQRLLTPKPIHIMRLPEWPAGPKAPARTTLVKALVNEVVSLRQEFGPTVGLYVNTVRLATEMASELRKVETDGGALNVVLLCGRRRTIDVERIEVDHPGLLSLRGNQNVDVIVATQTLEVGIDIDLSAAISELAPGGALTQRAGRVNRLGRRPVTQFTIVAPEGLSLFNGSNSAIDARPRWGPYEAEELCNTLQWLEGRASDPAGFAPSAVANDPPPTSSPKRTLFQRVELGDSWWWARTSDEVDPDPELDLWLADSLDDTDVEVGVVVRCGLPDDPVEAIALVRAIPPRDYEVFPAPLPDVRRLLKMAFEEGRNWGTALLVRGDEVSDISGVGEPQRLRPGDILVLDDKATVFTSGVVDPDGKEAMSDVLETERRVGPGDIVLRIDEAVWPGRASEILRRCQEILAEDSSRRRQHDELASFLHPYLPTRLEVINLLRGKLKDCDVIPFCDDDRLVRLLIVDQRSSVSDDGIRQTWSPSEKLVTLAAHSHNVGKRASEMASRIGLGSEISDLLGLAGKHHDDGKADPRFQAILGRRADDPPLAKGLRAATMGILPPSVLPSRWRHEQLSAVRAWDALADLPEHDRDLVVRLVGTSHGFGRSGFPHAAAELGIDEENSGSAAQLFDEGIWDEIIEQTNRRFGVWGCAYLEAIVRAADGQISGEGS